MVLVFGSNGQLATTLKKCRFASEATFLGSVHVDFADAKALLGALDRVRPRVIVNAAAYTKVEAAEQDREASEKINAEAVGLIGRWAKENDASVIHFSTDYVFSGSGTRPWNEHDRPAPLNWYGLTKWRGEELLAAAGCHSLTFRTSWVFSEHGSNFLKTMLALGTTRDELKIVADQIGAPTYAADIGAFIDEILPLVRSREVSGVYHLSNRGETSWHGFADYIFEKARERGLSLQVKTLVPVTTDEYPTKAKRPLNSRLDNEKTLTTFGIELPTWQNAVDRCLDRIGAPA